MSSTPAYIVPTCFVEADPQLQLARRATVECIGTLFLTTVAVGAGLAVTQVEPGNHGFALLLSALVTSGALVLRMIPYQSAQIVRPMRRIGRG